MNKFHKILLIMVSAFLVMMMPIVKAEAAQGRPGEKITVTFTFNDIRGIDGVFTFSNSDLFSDVVYSSSFPETRFNNNKVFYSTTEAGTKSGTISVIVTIKSGAKVGDTCTITLGNINLTDANTNSVAGASKSETVTVVASNTGNQNGDNNSQNNNTGTVTATATPGNFDTSSGNSSQSKWIDYSELKKQIEIANAVKTEGCTKQSKDAFAEALANAKNALSSTNQSEVDAAATALKDAINGMTKMDYSKLEAAIESGNIFTDSEEAASLIKQLMVALSNGALLLESDDQEAVDAATAEITGLLDQLQDILVGHKADFDPTAENEPDGDYCNIAIHKIWPILFFISLAGNVILIVLIVTGIKKKNAKPGDDTPLVDYEIDDDDI